MFSLDHDQFQKYIDAGLESRFTYFETWRQYENFHIVFWIVKDYAWITGNKILWVIALVPTFCIGYF